MKEMLKDMLNTLFILLGRPQSMLEFYLAAGAGALVMVLALSKAAEAAGARRYEFGWALLVAVLSLGGMLVIWSASRILIIPRLSAEIRAYALPAALAVILLLMLFSTLFGFRCSLTGAIMSWAVALAAAAVVTLLVGAAFDLWASMKKDARAAGVHKQTIEEFTDLLGR